MAWETAAQNERALELLDMRPTDHVLEVGFGRGRSLERAARQVPEGIVAGIDHSGQMVGMAERANARLVAQGRVDVRLGDSSALPWRDRSFDKAFTVNTIYFWKNPCGDLGELLRVLMPGGRLVVGFRYDRRAVRDFPEPFYRFWPPETVVSMLGETGFEEIRAYGNKTDASGFFWIVAERPSPA
jgi:ubiquinone/menaquinone biosynthesis C-methylase UbiE